MGERIQLTGKIPETKRENSLFKSPKPDGVRSIQSTFEPGQSLQSAIGNQAMQRLLQADLIQAKLKIGQPNDQYEQEADRIAEQVIRMPEPNIQRTPACSTCGDREEETPVQPKLISEQITPLVQRQAEEDKKEEEEEEEEEEPIQAKFVDHTEIQRQEEEPEEEKEEPLQTKQASGQRPYGNQRVEAQIHAIKGGGQPLPASVRAYFEPRFGYDFSRVRVHTDARAVEAARVLNALAFTVGQHVTFNQNQYHLETLTGRNLLAHELVHTIQQKESPRVLQRADESAPAPESAKKKDSRIDCYVYIYDTGDPELTPIWKASAQAFARARQGLAVESGPNSAETIKKVIEDYTKANKANIYRGIRAIEFFGHGSPGSALNGKFSAKDFETKEVIKRVKKEGKEVEEKSHVLKNADLQEQFVKLKGLLCSESYFHFRTCETFKGSKGEEFAKKVSSYFGTYAIGHKEIIDTFLPGTLIFDPKGVSALKPPSTLIPPKTPVAQLPFQHFIVKIDISQTTIPILSRQKPTLYVTAEILSGEDPETYKLRMTFSKPEIVELSEVFDRLASVMSGSRISPTVKSAQKVSDAVIVPVDRQIIETLNEKSPSINFTIPTKMGSVMVKISGKSGKPSWLVKKGGIQPGADLGVSWNAAGTEFVARPFLQIPFYNWRNLLKLSAELGAYWGSKETIMGEGRLKVSTHPLDLGYLALSAFGGGGLYRGSPGYIVGGALGVGYQRGGFGIGFSSEIAKTSAPGPTVNLFLTISWRFGEPE